MNDWPSASPKSIAGWTKAYQDKLEGLSGVGYGIPAMIAREECNAP